MRKFRILRSKNPCNLWKSGDVVEVEGNAVTGPYEENHYYERNFTNEINVIIELKRQYELEEITEPRIELSLVGFERGDKFKLINHNGTKLPPEFVVKDNMIWTTDGSDYSGTLSCILGGKLDYTIELIKEPTEKEKLEQRMRELAEKHKQEMDELAEQVKILQ